MTSLRPEDIIHKSHLNHLLIEIVDSPLLAQTLAFKGGTCAAMLGYLDRFSVDLDFDLLQTEGESELRQAFRAVFSTLGFTLVRELENALFFQVRYPNDPGKRNMLKVSASCIQVKANQYRAQYFPEIDRLMNSQTLETMVANKLVAVTDRFERHKAIAGRDIYDIHYFLSRGYTIHTPILLERTSMRPDQYIGHLIQFIQKNITQRMMDEDLNTLLPLAHFQRVRKVLLPETISLLAAVQRELEAKK